MELLGAISSRDWSSHESNHDNQFMSGLDFITNPNNHNHLTNSLNNPSFEFPFSVCNNYEGNESYYSFGPYSDDHHPVACDTSNSSIALCEQEIDMRPNTDFYLNIDRDHQDPLQCLIQEMVITDQDAAESEIPSKKRNRTNSIDHYQGGNKRKRNVRPRKDKTLVLSNEEENLKWPISPKSSSSKEENSNSLSEQLRGIASSSSPKGSAAALSLNLDGKARASRGSASDPQSVYARKRREKINERLRILQNLVPNGTKVDISTMLEDAVQYVKFLQLQIKLLSSDDLWMYAPLAYNGMNMETMN